MYTLFQLCTRWVGANINRFCGSNNALPEEVVDRVLAYFMANRTLNAEVLSAFLGTAFKHLSLDEGGWLPLDCFTIVPKLCPALQSLSLANCTQLTPAVLDTITKECTELRALSLRGCTQLDDATLLTVSQNNKQLVYLDLHSARITPATIGHIANNCHNLEFIGLGECRQINNVALQHLSKLSNLKEINVRMCALVSDNGIASLLEGPAGSSLVSLDTSHCGKITDIGLKTMSNMPQLRSLNFNGMMKITSAGIEYISKGCPNLESLNIAKCKLLDDNAIKFIFENAENLTTLDMSFLDNITDEAFSVVPSTSSLASLILIGDARITDVTLKRIASSMPYLQVLNLWKCSLITDEGVVAVGKACNRLRMIQLSDCTKITDKSVFALANGCPQLSTVILGGWATITDEGVKALSQSCKDIRTIDLGGLVCITNKSLVYLSESCPNLYAVSLYDCKSVTEEGIHTLVGCSPALRRIDLGGKTGVTREQATSLKDRYAHLEIAV